MGQTTTDVARIGQLLAGLAEQAWQQREGVQAAKADVLVLLRGTFTRDEWREIEDLRRLVREVEKETLALHRAVSTLKYDLAG